VEGGLQSCSEWITQEWATRSIRFCTDDLPYYFGNLDRTPGSEGCSASVSTKDGSMPEDVNEPKCKIYGSLTDELSNIDSCYNINALALITCPQADAKRLMNSFGTNLPVIFNCSYIPRDGSTNGMPTSCYDPERAILFIKASPNMNADQKNSFITAIRSRRDERCCNYVKPVKSTTGYTMTVPGGAKVLVQKITPIAGDTTYIAQNSDKIIFFKPDAKQIFMLTGRLSNYDLSSNSFVGDIFKAIGSTYEHIENINSFSVSKD
jgi:hypothetical protein